MPVPPLAGFQLQALTLQKSNSPQILADFVTLICADFEKGDFY
jgi:hypothetical protein